MITVKSLNKLGCLIELNRESRSNRDNSIMRMRLLGSSILHRVFYLDSIPTSIVWSVFILIEILALAQEPRSDSAGRPWAGGRTKQRKLAMVFCGQLFERQLRAVLSLCVARSCVRMRECETHTVSVCRVPESADKVVSGTNFILTLFCRWSVFAITDANRNIRLDAHPSYFS